MSLVTKCSSCSFWKPWTYKHDIQVYKKMQLIWFFIVNVHNLTFCNVNLKKDVKVKMNGVSFANVGKCFSVFISF